MRFSLSLFLFSSILLLVPMLISCPWKWLALSARLSEGVSNVCWYKLELTLPCLILCFHTAVSLFSLLWLLAFPILSQCDYAFRKSPLCTTNHLNSRQNTLMPFCCWFEHNGRQPSELQSMPFLLVFSLVHEVIKHGLMRPARPWKRN